MSRITPRYKPGDMFAMEPDSRIIIASKDDLMQFYRVANVMQEKITAVPDYEVWTYEKVHMLVDRNKLRFVCNILQIVVVPFTFLPRR